MVKLKPVESIKFRIAMETLTRIGVFAKDQKNVIHQKAFMIKVYDDYYVAHYKEILDHELDAYDKATLNTIALLLQNWGLVECENDITKDEAGTVPSITVLNREKSKEYKKMSVVKGENILDFIMKLKVNVQGSEINDVNSDIQ